MTSLTSRLLLLTALLCWISPAAALRIEYRQDSALTGCPGAAWIEARVLGLLARPDRFSRAFFSVEIQREGRDLVAALSDGAGGRRRLTDRPDRCAALSEAAAISVAIALEPVTGPLLPPPQRGGHPPAPLTLPPTIFPSAHRLYLTEPPTVLWLSAGPSVLQGLSPSLAPAISGSVGVRRGPWGITAEAHLGRPSPHASGGGEIEGEIYTGAAWLCRWDQPLPDLAGRLCAGGAAGLLAARGRGFVTDGDVLAPLLAPGLRAGLAWPASGPWAVDLWTEALIPLSVIRLRVDDAVAWESARLGLTAGLSVQLRL